MRLPPLLAGAGAGLLVAALLAPATGDALGALAVARAERAARVAERAAPRRPAVPLVEPRLALRARDPQAARRTLAARIRTQATGDGLLVEALSGVESPPGLAVVRVQLSGPEKAVLAFADRLENGRPLVRLRDWRIVPVAGGVRLRAEAVAPWQ